MGRTNITNDLNNHKERSLNDLDTYISSLINSGNDASMSKADKILFWLRTYSKYLNYETRFTPTKLCRYKRGQVIKADFGFRIGSEYGGLHYAIVIDKDNSIYSPVVTVVPLTSLKENTDVNKLKKGQIYLGDELYEKLIYKVVNERSLVTKELKELGSGLQKLRNTHDNTPPEDVISKINEYEKRANKLERKLTLIDNIFDELSHMKHGSIALTTQITTISKIRISDPKNSAGVLHNIRISSEALNLIDSEIIKLYTGM